MPERSAPWRALACCLVALAACNSRGAASPRAEPDRLGRFRAQSVRLPFTDFEPSRCESGERQSFLGADLHDPQMHAVVRLVVDPLRGPAVRAFDARDPFGEAPIFRKPDCSRFRVSLEWTGWRVNDFRDYEVALDVDCALPDGSRLEGSARAAHCH